MKLGSGARSRRWVMYRDPSEAVMWVLPATVGLALATFGLGIPEAHACQWGALGARPPGLHGPHWLGLAAVAALALVMVVRGRMRLHAEMRRLDLAQRLLERGLEPPRDLLVAPVRQDHRRGIVLLFAGLGLFAAGLFLGDRGLVAGALVPEFIGAGYLLCDRLERLSRERGR